jgi:hypothetical protein
MKALIAKKTQQGKDFYFLAGLDCDIIAERIGLSKGFKVDDHTYKLSKNKMKKAKRLGLEEVELEDKTDAIVDFLLKDNS